MIPQIVPSALNSANNPATISVELLTKYRGTKGIPYQPVESRPENVRMMKRYLAVLKCWMLKNSGTPDP